jgi:hypothetical protein
LSVASVVGSASDPNTANVLIPAGDCLPHRYHTQLLV